MKDKRKKSSKSILATDLYGFSVKVNAKVSNVEERTTNTPVWISDKAEGGSDALRSLQIKSEGESDNYKDA